ncbi:hypothetical protein JG687_00008045 [Phytophthora cactorum]|uniref:Histone RNA hairpin-binding protein RNA-binding domain-containing protein n=1 Tax=Phytophthora cactorum TaxID=29920 RepID=A0A8T1UI18_9STRA|nr:hypothetical protein PC123_g9787 [Phytophthora cactorum]KAG6960770.1 hypothetical protein JG687_00008045 [Phytophthora cactorum]
MKRGAEAMDGGDWDNYKGNRGWKGPNHKRMRHGDREHYRNGNGKDDGGVSGSSDTKGPVVKTLADDKETDSHRLAQRQKQIDYGKNTIGYDRYCAQVPRHQRRPGKHPMTPDKTMRIGKKVFDGMVRRWRQALHKYDPPELAEAIATVKTETAGVLATSSTSATDAKIEGGSVATSSSATMATSTQPELKKEEASTPPSRSIYENFDEDNFDEDAESDDDLL